MLGQWAQSEANGLFCAEEETWVPLCQACLAYTCWPVLLRLFQSLQTGMVAWLNLGWNGRREAGSPVPVPCRAWWWYMQVVCENGRVAGGSVQSEGQGEGRGQTRSEQGRMDQGPELEKDPMVRAATLCTGAGGRVSANQHGIVPGSCSFQDRRRKQ